MLHKPPPNLDWPTANQRHLMAAVALVQAHIAARVREEGVATETDAKIQLDAAQSDLPGPSALDRLCEWFGLSTFERDILVLCAGVELSGGFADFIAKLPQSGGTARPTFSLALYALPEAHWSALVPDAPLRYWHLIIPGSSDRLVNAPLRIDERVLHFLAGISTRDARLAEVLEPITDPLFDTLPSSQAELARQLAATWTDSGENWPVLQLCGAEPTAMRAVAAATCQRLRMRLHALDVRDLPTAPVERHQWLRLWERESILSDSALLIECSDGVANDVIRAVQRTSGAVFVSAPDALPLSPRPSMRVEVPPPTSDEQRKLWVEALGPAAAACNGQIDAVISQFALPAAAIAVTARLTQALLETTPALRTEPADARGESESGESPPLWRLCRAQVSVRLGELAQHIEPRAAWDDLVLPVEQKNTLRTIVAQVRQRGKVYDEWGFAARSARGLGLSTLFSGPSGTGKTMAAEVIARALALDLYRIDLSSVVSKYIGETEKNLRRVFDAAESGGAVLLFDEADALFGRRSEVKDSHDRYANIEVSYLLQRMEAYRGLAILTTNLKEALDAAFLRRLRFVVQFPYPDAAQRALIWEKTVPKETPRRELDFAKLARLNVTGGSIRNIAINAAFLAADDGEPLQMRHLRLAVESEVAKLERPLLETEVAGWV